MHLPLQDSVDNHLGFVYNCCVIILRMFFLYAFTCLTLHAQLKVATVRMSDIFNQFPETVVYRDQTIARKAAIENDKRKKDFEEKIAVIKKFDEEGQLLIFNLQKITRAEERAPEEAKIRALLEKRKLELEVAKSIQEEFEEFKQKTTEIINKEMAVKMRSILNIISAEIAKYAGTKGFDLVFDVSGFSNTGLPVILYAKPGNTTDITEEILKKLCPKTEKAAPKEAAPVVPNP